LIRETFKFLIVLYRMLISPFLPPACRFNPSCSEYALEAFSSGSVLRAIYLTVKRIARCHPLGGGGYDPVPVPSITVNEEKAR